MKIAQLHRLPLNIWHVGRAHSTSFERSEALLGCLPLPYGGQLHMWGQFYIGGTGGSIQVAPANNI